MQKVPIARFIAALGDALARGDGYIMGAYGQNPRTGYLDLNVTEVKAAWKPGGWYYSQYTDPEQHAQALKWRETCARVWDCNGLAEGIYQLETGTCINDKARGNYASWCDPKGEGMIPAKYRVPGAAVFWGSKASKIDHVAFLYEPIDPSDPSGDWWLIEAKGVLHGVVRTKLSQRKPKYWGWMSAYYDYTGSSDEAPVGVLQRGDVGEAVRDLQKALASLGYNLGKFGPEKDGCDGEFGKATQEAVKQFQRDNGLPVTGIFGPAAQAILDKLTTNEPRYTVTLKGLSEIDVSLIREKWPEAEVQEE